MTISSRSDGPRHVGRVVDPEVREDGEIEPDLQLSAGFVPDSGSDEPKEGDPEAAALASQESSETEDSVAPTEMPPCSAALAPGHAAPQQSADAFVAPEQPAREQAPSPISLPPVSRPTPTESEASLLTPQVANEPLPGFKRTGHPIRDKLLQRARAGANSPSAAPPEASAAEHMPALRGVAELEGLEPAQNARDAELDRIGTPLMQTPAPPVIRRERGQLSPNMIALFGSLIGLATVASLIALAMNFDAQPTESTPGDPPQSTKAVEKSAAKPPPGAIAKRERKKLPGPWRIVDDKDDPTTRVVEGTVGNKAFLVAVADAGIKQKEAYRLLIAYKGLRDLDKCDRSDRFRGLVERGTGRLRAFEYEVSAEEVYQAKEDENGYLKARRLDLKVARNQVKGAFMFDGEKIKTSAAPAGFEKGLRTVLSTALEGHSSVDELEKGDRLRVVAQEVTVLGEFARYAGIEALEVLPSDSKSKPLRIYYFHHPKAGGYYNARGQAPYEGGWRVPVKGAPVTSKFNPKRMHPVLKKVMPHNGTDFGAPAGTPVGASSYGTVSFIGAAGASGNLVKIDHAGGIETGYAHLSRFAEGLKVGDKVKRLQLVGYVGSTGRSTGPHLHFSAKKDGKFIDAESLNLDGMRVIPRDFRSEFAKAKERYDKLLASIPLPPAYVPPKQAVAAETTPSQTTEPAEATKPKLEALGSNADSEAEERAASNDEAEPTRAPEPARPSAKGTAAIYLTDKELLNMQTPGDDGEVEE